MKFRDVTLDRYIRFCARLLDIGADTPEGLADCLRSAPEDPKFGGGFFSTIPTPGAEWGFLYETVSRRQLVWLPGDQLHALGMDRSEEFRSWLIDAFGRPDYYTAPPAWLEAALVLGIWAPRPPIIMGEWHPIPEDHAYYRDFLAALATRPPLEYYADWTPPEPSEDEDAYQRELRAWEALQTLRQADDDTPVQVDLTGMKLVNLTRHPVTLAPVGLEGPVVRFPPAPDPVGVELGWSRSLEPIEVEGLPVSVEAKAVPWPTGQLVDLPEPQEGTLYLVTRRVLEIGAREDLVTPDTRWDSGIWDDQGNLIAVRRLIRWTKD